MANVDQDQERRGWDRLPKTLAQRIFQRLGPDDYFTASHVCPVWYAAAMEDPAVTLLPMILFPSYRASETTRFHSLVDNRPYEMPLTHLNSAMCRGATAGWVLFEERGGALCVYNMLHGAEFYVPTHKTRSIPPLEHLLDCTPVQRRQRSPNLTMAIMSGEPSVPDCAIAAVVGKTRLVMCRLSDLKWVFVADCDHEEGYFDLVHHNGCFYALEADNNLTVFDAAAPNPTITRIEAGASCAGYGDPPAADKYLVESLGELLLVENTLELRVGEEPVARPPRYVRIFKLDKRNSCWIPVVVDVEWSCSDVQPHPVETAAENSEPAEPEDDVGEETPVEVELDKAVRGRLFVLGRGTSRSLASDGFPDVTKEAFNRVVMYSLYTDETTLLLPKRGCDLCSAPIWVTPNPRA